VSPADRRGLTSRVRALPGRPWTPALVVLLALGVGGCSIWSLHDPLAPAATMSGHASRESAPNPASAPLTSAQDPARTVLDKLADTLTNTGYDTETGRYMYVHFRERAFATSVTAVFDEQMWVGDDGSGRDVRQRYPDQPLGATPRPAGGGPVRTDAEDFPAAGFPRGLPAPPSADPSVLATQLDQISPRRADPEGVTG
jgi:hypothetical protein